MTRSDNVLNMQITIANCMREAWSVDFSQISDMMEEYDLLAYIDDNYEEYNSMGIKGILLDLKEYIDDMEGDG